MISQLEKLLTPERFADILCEDLHLPPAQFAEAIVTSIREQLEEYHLYAPHTHAKPAEPENTTVKTEESNQVTAGEDRVMTEVIDTAQESLPPASAEQPPATEEELRIIIKVSQSEICSDIFVASV